MAVKRETPEARTYVESTSKRIEKRGGTVMPSLIYSPSLSARNREFSFRLGEDSDVFKEKDGSGGKINTFSKGVCEKMFGKTYVALNNEQRNFVDNLALILAQEYGIEMNYLKPGEWFVFDFSNDSDVGKFSFYKADSTAVIENKDLRLSRVREDHIKATREALGLERMTAEAQSELTGVRKGVIDVATSHEGIVSALDALVKGISYEQRKELLKEDDLWAMEAIKGINKYLRKYYEEEKGLSGEALDKALEKQLIAPDGNGYRGTAPQNRAWVRWIREIYVETDPSAPAPAAPTPAPAAPTPAPAAPTPAPAAPTPVPAVPEVAAKTPEDERIEKYRDELMDEYRARYEELKGDTVTLGASVNGLGALTMKWDSLDESGKERANELITKVQEQAIELSTKIWQEDIYRKQKEFENFRASLPSDVETRNEEALDSISVEFDTLVADYESLTKRTREKLTEAAPEYEKKKEIIDDKWTAEIEKWQGKLPRRGFSLKEKEVDGLRVLDIYIAEAGGTAPEPVRIEVTVMPRTYYQNTVEELESGFDFTSEYVDVEIPGGDKYRNLKSAIKEALKLVGVPAENLAESEPAPASSEPVAPAPVPGSAEAEIDAELAAALEKQAEEDKKQAEESLTVLAEEFGVGKRATPDVMVKAVKGYKTNIGADISNFALAYPDYVENYSHSMRDHPATGTASVEVSIKAKDGKDYKISVESEPADDAKVLEYIRVSKGANDFDFSYELVNEYLAYKDLSEKLGEELEKLELDKSRFQKRYKKYTAE